MQTAENKESRYTDVRGRRFSHFQGTEIQVPGSTALRYGREQAISCQGQKAPRQDGLRVSRADGKRRKSPKPNLNAKLPLPLTLSAKRPRVHSQSGLRPRRRKGIKHPVQSRGERHQRSKARGSSSRLRTRF